MDSLSSTEFAFVAALYLFSPTALQAGNGDFGQMLRAAAPGDTRQLIRQADTDAQHRQEAPDGEARLAYAAAARARKLQREREAYAAASAAWRQPRPGIGIGTGTGMGKRLVVSSTAP